MVCLIGIRRDRRESIYFGTQTGFAGWGVGGLSAAEGAGAAAATGLGARGAGRDNKSNNNTNQVCRQSDVNRAVTQFKVGAAFSKAGGAMASTGTATFILGAAVFRRGNVVTGGQLMIAGAGVSEYGDLSTVTGLVVSGSAALEIQSQTGDTRAIADVALPAIIGAISPLPAPIEQQAEDVLDQPLDDLLNKTRRIVPEDSEMPQLHDTQCAIWPSIALVALIIVAAIFLPYVPTDLIPIASLALLIGIMTLSYFQRRFWHRTLLKSSASSDPGWISTIGIGLLAVGFLWHFGGSLIFSGVTPSAKFWITVACATIGIALSFWNVISPIWRRGRG